MSPTELLAGLVAFLVELAAWLTIAAGSFLVLSGVAAWIVAVVIFAVVIALWSIFMAQKAPKHVRISVYYIIKVALYAVAAFILFHIAAVWATIFVLCFAASEPYLYKHNFEKEKS